MPKVIDLPTSTSMSDSDYLIMEQSSGGTKKITRGNAIPTSTASGIVTRTSGANVQSSYIRIHDKTVYITVNCQATASVSSGSNAFVGAIAAGYRPSGVGGSGISYYAGTALLTNINENGTITVRVIGDALPNLAQFAANAMYLIP